MLIISLICLIITFIIQFIQIRIQQKHINLLNETIKQQDTTIWKLKRKIEINA